MIMAPTTTLRDYVSLIVGGAVICAFVFAVSTTYRTEPSSQASMSLKRSGPSKKSSLRSASSTTAPNIIFIMADDLGWNGIGVEDWDMTEATERWAMKHLSPTLHTLAAGGIPIRNYYSQEVCTPARAALLTGRYPINLGMQYGVVEPYIPWGLNASETTLAQVLKDNGYETHIIGKWHLGHHSARMLPTARGFDSFVGYLDGDNYYYSKASPTFPDYLDFTVANTSCFGYSANASAYTTYSTEFYRDLAIKRIDEHLDTPDTPLFLYLAFQAVHNPYYDPTLTTTNYYTETLKYTDNNGSAVSDILTTRIPGEKVRNYALTLNVFDQAVQSIVDHVTDAGMMDNTYIIFASDNGGCLYNGGRNAPLRGFKATLYEGGTKVDSFIYSPTLLAGQSGKVYDNLFHVSDWFPTILDMAGVTYDAPADYELDGYSHYEAILYVNDADYDVVPREYMLYNAYTKVLDSDGSYDFDVWTNGVFAIRNTQYKLIHTYNASVLTETINDDVVTDDDAAETGLTDCKQIDAYDGDYQMEFFDLVNDPYEKTNLYYSDDDDLIEIRTKLYSQLFKLNNNAVIDNHVYLMSSSTTVTAFMDAAEDYWDDRGTTIGPYEAADYGIMESLESLSYPDYCGAMTP